MAVLEDKDFRLVIITVPAAGDIETEVAKKIT
jgi:hypothetical protein